MNKGGLIVAKKEMTKMWIDEKFVPVTLVKIVPQEIVRYKTQEKDGYVAAVIGVEKSSKTTKKGEKTEYKLMNEIKVDDSFVESNEAGKVLDLGFLQGITSVSVIGTAKGKGFQGVMKKFHSHGMPYTHGHKFRRVGGSMGNRKPRRVQKGHPHAGHMGTQRITLKNIKILDTMSRGDEQLVVIGGSLPGAYNSLLTLLVN